MDGQRTDDPKVPSERALHVLAYNPTRVVNIIGFKQLMAAIWREEFAHHSLGAADAAAKPYVGVFTRL